MDNMNSITIPVISKDEFRKLLLENLVHDKEDWTVENVMDSLLTDGFPKLDFDDLSKCLPKMWTYMPTVAVDIGDARFIWVVSGMNAVLINKETWKPAVPPVINDPGANHVQPCNCPYCK